MWICVLRFLRLSVCTACDGRRSDEQGRATEEGVSDKHRPLLTSIKDPTMAPGEITLCIYFNAMASWREDCSVNQEVFERGSRGCFGPNVHTPQKSITRESFQEDPQKKIAEKSDFIST